MCLSILLNRSPEFFYPGVFVKIKEAVQETPTTTSASSLVFHGTHLEEVTEICQGNNAIFKGNLKEWRLLHPQLYNKEYCSYNAQPGQPPEPMRPNNSLHFGPFVWFGTKKDETDNYGPCQFEFNFMSILNAYHKCRNNQIQYSICYRAAGTLVYKKEVSHIVMICCLEDHEWQDYPLITANSTRYFKPPNPLNNAKPTVDVHFQTTINEYQRRHEHVSFALYLPNNRKLYLSCKDGRIRLTPHKYCVKSRSNQCVRKEDQILISIDKLKMITQWISHNGEQQEEPDIEYTHGNVLDQSLEDSFDWLSSADETENYGYEDDQNDWYDYEDYNEADFEGFYDNNEHSDSASDFTIYYSSSSNTEYYDSED